MSGDSEFEQFFKDVEKGNANRVKSALQANGEELLKPRGSDNSTALHIASQIGDEAIVDILLRNNANINAQNNIGETPLHLAIKNYFPNVVRKLLSYEYYFWRFCIFLSFCKFTIFFHYY